MTGVRDSFGRSIDYLRISVTDRCNLRCLYCMPLEAVPRIPHSEILSIEEIRTVVQAGAELGINKIRLTGGEPLVRAELPELIKMLSQIEGIRELSLTTNGTLLKKYALELKQAGLSRVNVSLDTLNTDRFQYITRLGRLKEHRDKIFNPSLIEYITGCILYPEEPWKRRVIALVYQGPNAIEKIRDISGPTNPHIARETKPGCIRALGTVVPLKDAEGNVIGERMDNLIHASATDSDAEREIKLWFRPNDIPPFMQDYPTEVSDEHYCFKHSKLYTTHEPGSVCLLAPGYVAWKSDLEALHLFFRGLSSPVSIEAVAAKYLINEKRDSR